MGLVARSPLALSLLLNIAIIYCDAKGDFEDFDRSAPAISKERIAQFYTETLVVGAGKPEQKCSDNVFKSREAAIANGKKVSLGVEPTVGLGAALLIFLGVGVFAVGVAQAFQMVSELGRSL